MTRVLATIVVGYAGFASAATAPAMYGKPGCSVTQAKFRTYARNVYRRDNVSHKALWKMARDRKCARSAKAGRNMAAYQRSQSRQRRERRLLDAVTPYGAWAIPEAIVMCESHGNFRAVNGSNPNRPAGAYQIITSTWHGYGGGAFAPTADAATPYEQHVVAGRIWAGGRGRGQWAC